MILAAGRYTLSLFLKSGVNTHDHNTYPTLTEMFKTYIVPIKHLACTSQWFVSLSSSKDLNLTLSPWYNWGIYVRELGLAFYQPIKLQAPYTLRILYINMIKAIFEGNMYFRKLFIIASMLMRINPWQPQLKYIHT